MPSAGNPSVSLVKTRGPNGDQEISLHDLLTEYYSNTPGSIPQRQDQNWTGSITVSQLALIFNVSGTLSAANDVAPWIVLPFAFTLFSRSRMGIKTLPTVTNSVSVDIKRSTDNGATFSTILTANPAFAPGAANSKIFPFADFGNTNLNAGDVLRLDILTVGDTVPGADLTIWLCGFIPTS